MIIDPPGTIEYLAKWLGEYTKEHGVKSVCFLQRPWVESYVTLHVCLEARKFNSNLDVFVYVEDSDPGHFEWNLFPTVKFVAGPVHSDPVERYLAFLASARRANRIVVGDYTKTYLRLIRAYHKLEVADLYPLATLKQSEVVRLGEHLFGGREFDKTADRFPEIPDDISHEDIEWTQRGGLLISKDPHLRKDWSYWTTHQKMVVSHLCQREKRTRHKNIYQSILDRGIAPHFGCRQEHLVRRIGEVEG